MASKLRVDVLRMVGKAMGGQTGPIGKNLPISTMATWPALVQPGPYSGDQGLVTFAGHDGELYGFRRGHPITARDYDARRAALPKMMDALRKEDVTREQIIDALPETIGIVYRVGVMVVRHVDGTDYVLVEATPHQDDPSHVTLGFPETYVRRGETIFTAATRRVTTETPLGATVRSWAAFDPRDRNGLIATFMVVADFSSASAELSSSDQRRFHWIPLVGLMNCFSMDIHHDYVEWLRGRVARKGLHFDVADFDALVIAPAWGAYLSMSKKYEDRRGPSGLFQY